MKDLKTQALFAIVREALAEIETRMGYPGEDALIEDLEFSRRTYNCLNSIGISTISQLRTRTDYDLLQIPGFGQTCLNEVRHQLRGWLGIKKLDEVQ